jgi:hypothetical protein
MKAELEATADTAKKAGPVQKVVLKGEQRAELAEKGEQKAEAEQRAEQKAEPVEMAEQRAETGLRFVRKAEPALTAALAVKAELEMRAGPEEWRSHHVCHHLAFIPREWRI